MTLAIEGYGSFIQRSPDGITYTTIAEVSKISGPGSKTKAIDASHLLSPSSRMEFVPGMTDEGEVKLELNFTKAEFAALRATINTTASATTYFWKITFSQGSLFAGAGFITDLEPTLPVDDKLSVACTVKATGLWTFTQ